MSVALASSSYLSLGQKLVSSYPFSLAIWVAGSTSNANQAAILQGSSSSSRYAMGWFTNFGANKNASYQNVANGSSAAAKTTTPDLSASTMRLMIVVFESATSRRVYFGSNTPATDSTNLADETTNHNQILIGCFQYNGGAATHFLGGSVAEAAVFNAALTGTDYDSLAGGTLAETFGSCVACFPLRTATDLTSTNGTYTLTVNGSGVTTSGIAHPVSRSSGDATANGVTMTATASLIAGSASGTSSGTAGGQTLTATASLIAGSASGVVNGTLTIPVVNNTDTSLPSTTIPHVVVHKLSDRVEKFNAASQATNGSGDLVLVSSNFTAGQDYIAAGWNADGSLAFVVKATAT